MYSFINPIILTVGYLPFSYLLAVYMVYEMLFVRLSIFIKNDPKLVKFIKRRIIFICHFNLFKLIGFSKESVIDLMNFRDKNDVIETLNRFKAGLPLRLEQANEGFETDY